MTPRETVEVTHTFPRFRIAIFHLVSHALPLAHRSVDCDVLSPASSPLLSSPPPGRSSSFLKGLPRPFCPFAIYWAPKRALSFLSGKNAALHRKYVCGFPKMLPRGVPSSWPRRQKGADERARSYNCTQMSADRASCAAIRDSFPHGHYGW